MLLTLSSAIGALGTLLGKTGALESALSRKRREAAVDRVVYDPPSGTPLLVSLGVGSDEYFGIGVAEHSGIYLGNGRVAELNGNGRIMQVSLSEFVNGLEGEVMNTRNGTCIFGACDENTDEIKSHKNAALNAQTYIDRGVKKDYNVFGNNCHMFTASCLLGGEIEKMSKEDWFVRGTFTVVDLELIIEHILNDGKRMGWRRIMTTPEFQYVLTPEKRIRLYREGKIQAPRI